MAIEDSPASIPLLEQTDIQGLLARGNSRHPHAAFLLLRVVDAAPARRWIGSLAKEIPHLRQKTQEQELSKPLLHVALSHLGMEALRLDRALLDGFPAEFVEGMDTPQRALILGDVGLSASERWIFGSRACSAGGSAPAEDRRAHVLLMIYSTPERAAEDLSRFRNELGSHGLELLHTIATESLPGNKEPFGFRDGIAQPRFRIESESEAQKKSPRRELLPAGEFVLGYSDAFGERAHDPRTSAGFPFARNGSYLVLRQLRQDVGAFWRFLHAAAAASPSQRSAIELASKMVGRWPSGAPLVQHPTSDPGEDPRRDDNHFFYRSRDPEGLLCPPGAHIRRSNPRDWGLAADRKSNLDIVDRHRLLRRGRPYGPPYAPSMKAEELLARALTEPESQPGAEEPERGLAFVCLGADIERQFEFVQQQWVNNPKFAGLTSGSDPLTGWHRDPESGIEPPSFTIPAQPVRERVHGLQHFVTVRGGGYFLLPSITALRWIGEQR